MSEGSRYVDPHADPRWVTSWQSLGFALFSFGVGALLGVGAGWVVFA